MAKVLILAYDFPPYVSVGGLRPHSWYKYLHEFGIYPVVVTRQWDNKYGNHLDYVTPSISTETIIEKSEIGTIIRTPYFPNLSNKLLLNYGESRFKLLRKIITAYYEFAQFLFFIGPKSKLYFAAKKFLASDKVDVIIATGDPFILFRYAAKLSDLYDIPWIADYRDPWTQNANTTNNLALKIRNTLLEKKYLQNVKAISTVSTLLVKQIGTLLPDKTFHLIPNGYDPENVDKVKEVGQGSKKLSIACVGTIFNWNPLESFLRVCWRFIKKNPNAKFQINFYGVNAENKIKHLIQSKYKELFSFLSIYPKMPHEQLLIELASNNLFLLFNYYNYTSTKIYEYIALKRMILLCYSNDPEANELKDKYYHLRENESEGKYLQADLINETNSGIVVKDAAHLSTILEESYHEFETKGFIRCNTVNTERHSRKNQVQKLAEVIKLNVD